MDIVADAAEENMNLAVREIKDMPGYSDNRELCIQICVMVAIYNVFLLTVGNDRCQAWLHGQRLPYHGSMHIRKVSQTVLSMKQ